MAESTADNVISYHIFLIMARFNHKKCTGQEAGHALLFPFLQCPGIIFSQKSNLSVKFIFLHLKKRSILFAGFRKKNNGQMIMDNGQLLEASLPLNKEK